MINVSSQKCNSNVQNVKSKNIDDVYKLLNVCDSSIYFHIFFYGENLIIPNR